MAANAPSDAYERDRGRLVAETAQAVSAVAAQLHQLQHNVGVLVERGRAIDDVANLWTSFHARIVAHHTAAAAATAIFAPPPAAPGAASAAAGSAPRPPFPPPS